MKHNSRSGKASHIISIAVVLISVLAVSLARTGVIGQELSSDTKNGLVRLWISGAFLIAVISLGLGIFGLFRKDTKKLYSITGSSLAVVIIAGILTFLPLYHKSHYGYYGIENIFFSRAKAKSSPSAQLPAYATIFHARTVTKEVLDASLKASKRAVIDLRSEQLRFHVNRIYAYYGYPFRKPEMRSLFYNSASPYREDPSFSEDKIPQDHRALIDYLLRIERWQLRLAKKRSQGLLNYEKTEENRQASFEELGSVLAVDRKRGVSFTIDNVHLLVLQHPDNIPIAQMELPASIVNASEFSAQLSPNGRYLALRYHYTSDLDLKCVILLIDTVRPAILHKLSAGFGEIRSHAQFSRDSKLLYTTAGAYDVASGKKIKEWTYPTDHQSQDIDQHLTMYGGLLKDGSFLAGCWFIHRIYRVDPKVGTYTVFLDLEKEGQTAPTGVISPDGEMLAGGTQKTKVVGNSMTSEKSEFVIWKIQLDNTLQRIYSEEVTRKQSFACWTWGKGSTIFKSTIDKRNYYKLWRYDIVDGNVSLTAFPIDGLVGGQNRITVDPDFVNTYGRTWDIETGRKITPWYEAFDPFDESNLMPLYDKQPRAIQLRDFWK